MKKNRHKKQPAILTPPRWHATAQSSGDCWICASNFLPYTFQKKIGCRKETLNQQVYKEQANAQTFQAKSEKLAQQTENS